MTFFPKIHGPVSTRTKLFPASAADSSTFPMLPSLASTLNPARSTAGSRITSVRYVHISSMEVPPPRVRFRPRLGPRSLRYPRRREAKRHTDVLRRKPSRRTSAAGRPDSEPGDDRGQQCRAGHDAPEIDPLRWPVIVAADRTQPVDRRRSRGARGVGVGGAPGRGIAKLEAEL